MVPIDLLSELRIAHEVNNLKERSHKEQYGMLTICFLCILTVFVASTNYIIESYICIRLAIRIQKILAQLFVQHQYLIPQVAISTCFINCQDDMTCSYSYSDIEANAIIYHSVPMNE